MISQWETILRERGSGKFETRRAVSLSFKSRTYRRSEILQESDKERLLLCFQTNQAVVTGRFPLTRELALELAALMGQVKAILNGMPVPFSSILYLSQFNLVKLFVSWIHILSFVLLQIDTGDYKSDKGRGSGGPQSVALIMEKYYPVRYRENLSTEEYKSLCDGLAEKWSFLKGKTIHDCVRIYLTCTRKWPFFGATLFTVTVRSLLKNYYYYF